MLFVARPSLRVDWPWTPPVLWRLLPQSEAGFILVWYVGRRIVCMLLYWCGVVSVCWHLWFWSHSSGPYMMIPEYRLSHALPYTSLWIYGFLCAPLLRGSHPNDFTIAVTHPGFCLCNCCWQHVKLGVGLCQVGWFGQRCMNPILQTHILR